MTGDIGIKFTNTFFPYHDRGNFCLFSGDEEDKNTIICDIKSGHIDGIHSFGEKSDFNRGYALHALRELERYGCKLLVWIDHAHARGNLCKYRFFGKGDIPGEPEYHFDLTSRYGIRFVWTERLTNIIGQEVPLRPGMIARIYDSKYPSRTLINLAKTVAKIILDFLGYEKYDFFKSNQLLRVVTLRDGRKAYEFIRFNNHFKGASIGDTFEDLSYLISHKVLNQLKSTGGYCIVYVHLGKKFSTSSPNGRKTVHALRSLRREFEQGHILVDSVSRILTYCITTKYLKWHATHSRGSFNIQIGRLEDPVRGTHFPDPKELMGLTFYVPCRAKVYLRDAEIACTRMNEPDDTGQESITVFPWTSNDNQS